MTTQQEADEQGKLIGDIRRGSGDEQIADAFGQVNYRAHGEMTGELHMTPWNRLNERARSPWIAGAQAVLKAQTELIAGQTANAVPSEER